MEAVQLAVVVRNWWLTQRSLRVGLSKPIVVKLEPQGCSEDDFFVDVGEDAFAAGSSCGKPAHP